MKKFLISTMLAVTALTMVADALARPMGGGRSFGRQSQAVRQAPPPAPNMQRQAPSQAAAAPAAAKTGAAGAAAAAKKPSMMRNILGGALLGLGLGMLLSHLGIGGALASAISSIIMIALIVGVIWFIVAMIRRKSGAAPARAPSAFSGLQPAPAGAAATPEIGSGLREPAAFQGQSTGLNLDKPAPAHQPWGVPADFDADSFLRHAKSSFIRMQAAWDRGDVNDLREFTSPEVFAELKLQIAERNGATEYTDVVTIDAQLMGIEHTANDYLASVHFSGTMRHAPDALPEPFNEVWNMAKPLSGPGGWVLAGIQQVQ